MTEEQRILQILATMKRSDPDEVLRLHQQLPRKLSTAIMVYGLDATTEAIRDDPELLNHVGAMDRN